MKLPRWDRFLFFTVGCCWVLPLNVATGNTKALAITGALAIGGLCMALVSRIVRGPR